MMVISPPTFDMHAQMHTKIDQILLSEHVHDTLLLFLRALEGLERK